MARSSRTPPIDLHPVPVGIHGDCIALSFDSEQKAVRAALKQIDTAFRAAGLSPSLVNPAQIVLAEVFNNVVEHAYAGQQDGTLRVRMHMHNDSLICDVRDTGGPMPDGTLARDRFPDLDPEDPMTWPEGGFGWAMVRALTEDLRYERAGADNILRFRIPPERD